MYNFLFILFFLFCTIFVAETSPQARRYRGGRGGGGSSRGLFNNQEDDPIKNGRLLNDKGVLYIHYTVFPKKVTYQILSCLPKSPSFWEFFSNHGKQCLATKTSSFPFNSNELPDEWTLDQFLELANKEKSYWW